MTERHLTWDHFRETFIDPGVPALHPVGADPAIFLFVDEHARRIGIRCTVGAAVHPSVKRLPSELKVSELAAHGSRLLEIAVTDAQYFKAFYSLAVDIADRIQLQRTEVADAIRTAIAEWRQLLRMDLELSLERAIGLWGELWFARFLVDHAGAAAVAAWTGPQGEAHDFRAGDAELEVKTTLSERRVHVVNGAGQLDASMGRTLMLLSLQVMRAGAGGQSLADLRDDIRQRLGMEMQYRELFELALSRAGYIERSPLVDETFALRTRPGIVVVNSSFPRLSAPALIQLLGDDANRVSDIHYQLDVTGLVAEEGSRHYATAVQRFIGGVGGGGQ